MFCVLICLVAQFSSLALFSFYVISAFGIQLSPSIWDKALLSFLRYSSQSPQLRNEAKDTLSIYPSYLLLGCTSHLGVQPKIKVKSDVLFHSGLRCFSSSLRSEMGREYLRKLESQGRADELRLFHKNVRNQNVFFSIPPQSYFMPTLY